MKKEYIAPTSSCHMVQLGSMIAQSRFQNGQQDPQKVTVTEEETNEFTSRRRHSQWDDEEEDYDF